MAAAPPTRKIFSAGGYSLKAETAPSTFFLGQSHRPWHLKRSSYAQDSSQGRVKEPEPVLNARKTPDQQEIPKGGTVKTPRAQKIEDGRAVCPRTSMTGTRQVW